MKKLFFSVISTSLLLTITGCTSSIVCYDENGNVVKFEKVTNFSRAMDGTNNKSQMILIEGNCISFEASASAGENCTPGVSVKYADGKTAIVNAKDTSALNSSSKAVEKFFNSEVNIGIDGVTKK